MVNIREELLRGDFAETLKLLQNYPMNSDVGQIMNIALQIKVEDNAGKLVDLSPPSPSTPPTKSVPKKEPNEAEIQQLIKDKEKKGIKSQIRKPSVMRYGGTKKN